MIRWNSIVGVGLAGIAIAASHLLPAAAFPRPMPSELRDRHTTQSDEPPANQSDGIVVPTVPVDAAPEPATAVKRLTIQELEQAIYQRVNQHRRSRGLRPLRLDNRISTQARLHSQAMANRQVAVGHGGFDQRVRNISRRISSRRISENVGMFVLNNSLPNRAVNAWLQSPKHRAAMEDRHNLTGIGIVQDSRGMAYITQIFVRKR